MPQFYVHGGTLGPGAEQGLCSVTLGDELSAIDGRSAKAGVLFLKTVDRIDRKICQGSRAYEMGTRGTSYANPVSKGGQEDESMYVFL